MKITIQKPVGILGEVWLVEVPVTNDVLKSRDPVAGIQAATDVATRVMDDRLLQLNLRLMAHNTLANKLAPEAGMAVRQCVELMYGRMVGPDGQQPGQPMVLTPADVDKMGPTDEKLASNLEKALEAVDEGGR